MINWGSRLFTLLRLGIAAAVLLWLHLSGAISWATLGGLVEEWPLTLAALAIYAVDGVITAYRLCVLFAPLGARISLFNSVRLTAMGLFFSVCLPGGAGGDAVRIYYAAAGNPGARAELATVILFDRLVGMLAMFLWPVLAAPLFPDVLAKAPVIRWLISAAGLSAAGMLVGLGLMMSPRVRRHRAVERLLGRLPFGGIVERMVDTVHAYRRHPAALFGALAISLLTHTLAVAVVLLLALAIDPAVFAWRMSLLVPLGFLANTMPFTPGGLGVGEAAFEALFRMAGLRGGPEIMLGWRVIMLLTSLSGAVFYLQRKKKLVHVPSGIVCKESSTYGSAT